MPDPVPDFVSVAARAREMLGAEAMERIATYFERAQTENGGFSDRAGQADLYYTVFGLAGQLALGRPMSRLDNVRSYLDGLDTVDGLLFVELVSLIRCRRFIETARRAPPFAPQAKGRLIAALNRYRSRDGGYCHETHDAEGGTLYAVFLAEQAFRDLGAVWEDGEELMALMAARRTPDGGYANHAGASRGVATVTASAMTLLVRCGKRDAARRSLGFLDSLCGPDGGYRATPATPTPDLLSTAGALYARVLCGEPPTQAMTAVTSAFVERLWSDAGGFRGHALDPVPDVEYTFYALLALGSLCVPDATKTGPEMFP